MPRAWALETLSIRSDPDQIASARKWADGVALRAGLDEKQRHELTVALSEVCANAHMHAYSGRVDGRIDLAAEAADGVVRLTVRDYGVAFDPETPRTAQREEPRDGGYGLFLIRGLIDRVEYSNTGAGTQVVLIKSRVPAGSVGSGPASSVR